MLNSNAASTEALNNLRRAFQPTLTESPVGAASGDKMDLRAYLSAHGVQVAREKQSGNTTIHVLEKCLFDESHTRGESSICQNDSGLLTYQCFHNSCKGRTWHDARRVISGDTPLIEYLPERTAPRIKVNMEEACQDPINIFDEFSIGEAVWKPDYSPSVITDFAFDEAERMGALPEQIAGPAIINAAGVIDDRIKLQPKRYDDTWQEPARLWGATNGDSGAKKSPSKDRADATIKQIEKELYLEYLEKYQLYEIEMKDYEALRKRERAKATEPVPPVRRRVMCNDTTVEGMRDLLCDGGGATKLICSHDELSGWLGSMDAYRQSKAVSRDRSYILELWNGGPKPIDRAGKVNIYVPNWSACISGTITPEVLAAFFGKLDSDGLLQRFLLFRAKSTGRGIDRAPNYVAERRYRSAIKKLFEYSPGEDEIIIRLSDDAQAVRESFEKLVELAHHLPGNSHAYNAHLNKYPGLFCRLTLTYHLLSCFDSDNPTVEPIVSGEVAEMASAALIEYHLPAAREFYGKIGYADHGQEAARDLCGYILSKGLNEVTTSGIVSSVRALRGDTPGARKVMDLLQTYNWVRPAKFTKNRATQWEVNPAVHKMYAKQAAAEKVRRDAARAKIEEAVSVYSKGEV